MVTGTRTRKGVHEMKNLTLLCFVIAALGALALPAGAEPYWVAWEGNDLPENEGWTRTFCDADGVVGQGGAIRTMEDGALVLDSRESTRIVDFYNWSRPIDPGPGESFIMRWRVMVDDVPSTYPYDLTVGVFSDQYSAAFFALGVNGMMSVFEPELQVSYEAYTYHMYEMQSYDMLSYALWIDGEQRMTGNFESVFETSRVGWGDDVQGARSLSRWDYFRFGVVPEPNTLLLVVVLCIANMIKGERE
jgi:hypothetical protein